MAEVTVVFADLTGSIGVFESLGNTKATQAITRLTLWIGQVCETHHGRVAKYLGDGVLMLFSQSHDAIEAVTELQQVHHKRISRWPEALKMRLQVGLARGAIVEQNGDCYGDAVNVASRLSHLAGPDQILVTDTVIQQLPQGSHVRSRSMGAMAIRGRTEACVVWRVEWQAEVQADVFTVPASLLPFPFAGRSAQASFIELSWLDVNARFMSIDLPIFLGRDAHAQFVVQDPRVSRKHVRLEWRSGKFHLQYTSSYGTWVRFADSTAIVALRRQECVLLMEGEIALGAPFEDFTVPTVTFKFHTGPVTKR